MAAICAWAIWKDRRRSKLRFVDKLVVDDKAIRYSEFSHRTETMDWSEIDRVVYYFGPPDFPDPLVGYAPDREWQFYRHGRSIYVPDLGDHSRELAQWCGRKLPGFRADLLDQARTSIEQKSWVLWQRTGQPA
jgi:hypothetical protein